MPPRASTPSFALLVRVFAQIGLTSFGGPAGQIAMMHRVLVDERRWIDETRYFSALNFCMLLPGPEAMQLATYAGWRLHGVAGGVAAGALFVLPGACVMLALSLVYALYGQVPAVEAVFFGIKAAVLAIVVEALLRVARRALKGLAEWSTAAAAFLAIFFFEVPFPVVVMIAALAGLWRGRRQSKDGAAPATAPASASVASVRLHPRQTIATAGLWLAIWILPLLLVVAVFGRSHVLSELAWFFSKLAVVTFGGAYAVLAYMAQDVVEHYHWLAPGEMLDGLGLAETTPGPLILVTQFVGTLAAYRQGGGMALAMGLLGALVTLWATFIPCFLWVFTGAPYLERLTQLPRLAFALRSVTACVVGVILNLTVWFALHVLFANVTDHHFGPLKLTVPNPASVNGWAVALAALAVVLIFVLHRGIITTMAVCAAASVVLRWFSLL